MHDKWSNPMGADSHNYNNSLLSEAVFFFLPHSTIMIVLEMVESK